MSVECKQRIFNEFAQYITDERRTRFEKTLMSVLVI